MDQTDGRKTDGLTDRRTDGRTDRHTYRQTLIAAQNFLCHGSANCHWNNSVVYVLAELPRDDTNLQDYIVCSWEWIDAGARVVFMQHMQENGRVMQISMAFRYVPPSFPLPMSKYCEGLHQHLSLKLANYKSTSKSSF